MKEFQGTPFYAIADEVFTVNSESITSVYGDYTTPEQDEELATLFAAAPDLLSALQEVVKSLEITLRAGYDRIIDLGGSCDSPEVMIKGHSEIARAKQAIDKALGESQ